MKEIAVPKARSSGVWAFAFSLSLHSVAVGAVILSMRTTFDLFPEITLTCLAGSTSAILGALILTPMIWPYRVVLASAILVGVVAGTAAMRESDRFENPWTNHLPLSLNCGDSSLAKYDANTFFWTATFAILCSVLTMLAGSLAAKSAHRFLQKRMKTRTILMLGAALLLLIVSQYQSFVMNGGLFYQSAVAQTVLMVCGAVVFVLAPAMILYWSRSGFWAALGPFLVMQVGSLLVVITSSWFAGGASRPPVAHIIVLALSMAVFATFLILVGWPLRFLKISPARESKRPGRISIGLAIAPAIVLVVAVWQFTSVWDAGAIARSQDWELASVLTTGRNSGVCLNFSSLFPEVSVGESADPECIGELFRKLPDTFAGPYRQMRLRGLQPGIDLSAAKGMTPLFATSSPVWIVDRCLLDGDQLAALCQPGHIVLVMDTVQFAPKVRDVVLNGTLNLNFENHSLVEFLKQINLDDSSCGISIRFECADDGDLTELIKVLEMLSRGRGVTGCTCLVTVPESGDSRLVALARAEIDWRKIDLHNSGGEIPLDLVQKILVATFPNSRVPIRFSYGQPDEIKKGLRLMMAFPDFFYYPINSYGENVLKSIEDLKTVERIREAGYIIDDEDGSDYLGIIALRRKWLDVLSEEQIQSTEFLVVGGNPFGSVQLWTTEEYEGLSKALAKFSQLRELQGDQSCFADFGFLQHMTELRSLRLVADRDSVFAAAIQDYPSSLAKLERLVLIGHPSPEILAAIKTLPSLKSLTILSGGFEVDSEVSKKVEEMFPDLDARVMPQNQYLEIEPEILQLHRQRLREQFQRETEGE